MKGLKTWQVLKAIDEGHELEWFFNFKWIDCKHTTDLIGIVDAIENDGELYRIKQKNGRTVEMFGSFNGDRLENEQWGFDELSKNKFDTHKIKFLEDQDGKPIIETIKMIKL